MDEFSVNDFVVCKRLCNLLKIAAERDLRMKKKLPAALVSGLLCGALSCSAGTAAYGGQLTFEDGRLICVEEDGSRRTGWYQDEEENWYYFNEEGYVWVGWYLVDGKWYYSRMDSGKMVADRTVVLDGGIYWFDKNGVSTRLPADYTGWMKDDVHWMFRLPDGTFLTNDWREMDGYWYYFDETGHAKTGLLDLDGVLYYFRENGTMVQNERVQIGEAAYDFDENGAGTYFWPYKPITVIPPEEEKTELHRALDQMCDQILAGITTPTMTKRQKAEAIYAWVRRNFRYAGSSTSRDWVTEAYQGMRRKHGDCYTYFSVSQALLTRCGITCMEVIRSTDNHHYWNLVNCGDGWYHFDATPRSLGGYFCLWTDAQMAAYSSAAGNCFVFDRSLYPATPTN